MKQKLTPEDREAMIALYIENAHEMLANAHDNINTGHYKGAVNRMYYGAFYIVTGLLLDNNIAANTHSGIFNQFSLHFIHNKKLPIKFATVYRRLFEERSKGDYDIFTIFDRETVEEYLEQATQFIQSIEQEIKKQYLQNI